MTNLHMRDPSNSSTAPGIVESSDERPEELDDSCKQLAKVSKDDQEQGYPNDRVDDRGDPARSRLWSYVTVTCKINECC